MCGFTGRLMIILRDVKMALKRSAVLVYRSLSKVAKTAVTTAVYTIEYNNNAKQSWFMEKFRNIHTATCTRNKSNTSESKHVFWSSFDHNLRMFQALVAFRVSGQ